MSNFTEGIEHQCPACYKFYVRRNPRIDVVCNSPTCLAQLKPEHPQAVAWRLSSVDAAVDAAANAANVAAKKQSIDRMTDGVFAVIENACERAEKGE